MNPLPQYYPSPRHLPFNSESLKNDFILETPERTPKDDVGAWVLLQGTRLVLYEDSGGPALPLGKLPDFAAATGRTPVFIGTWKGSACTAMALPGSLELPPGYVFENILSSEPCIGIELLSLAGVAGQILHWEKNSRFCSRCGGTLNRLPGEWGKTCHQCDYAHFPHIHPCVIVIVRRKGEVLLTRKAAWPEGRYSLVAGFLDFGECLEEAVAREVREETGVEIDNVRYIGSQAWPFPSQLMAGFVADWAEGEIVVEEAELEDARWFGVDDLPALPPKRSIARYLIDTFAT